MPNSGILCSASFWRCDSPTQGKTDDPIYIRPVRFASLPAPWKHGALPSLTHILYDHCPATRVYAICTAARNCDLFCDKKLTSSYTGTTVLLRVKHCPPRHCQTSTSTYVYILHAKTRRVITLNHRNYSPIYRRYTLFVGCIACVTGACFAFLFVYSFFILIHVSVIVLYVFWPKCLYRIT